MRARCLPTGRRWAVPVAFVLLAVGGTMIGHAAVWSLLGGASSGLAAARSIHNYLRPVGAALLVFAAVASWAVWRAFSLVRRLAVRTSRALRMPAAPNPDVAAPTVSARPTLGTLWAALLAVQLCVYAVQENVEARAAHVVPPGIHVLTAQHGSPIILHAAVALALAGMVCGVWAALGRRRRRAERLVRILRAVRAHRGLVRPPAMGSGGTTAPVVLFGLSFLFAAAALSCRLSDWARPRPS